jgi:hypothetical protein
MHLSRLVTQAVIVVAAAAQQLEPRTAAPLFPLHTQANVGGGSSSGGGGSGGSSGGSSMQICLRGPHLFFYFFSISIFVFLSLVRTEPYGGCKGVLSSKKGGA